VLAEVVGFAGDRAFLMPAGDVHGLCQRRQRGAAAAYVPVPRGARYRARRCAPSDDWPAALALGQRAAGPGGGCAGPRRWTAWARSREVVARAAGSQTASTPWTATRCASRLDTGVRAINALLTVGRGQRMGLFAGSGVGKSVLLGMMARYTAGRRDRRSG